MAFRQWLGSSDRVAVGADPRLSSPEISDAFCRGAGACNVGAPTLVMLESLLAPSSDIAGSVMVTASHLPAEWNGLKFFGALLGRGLNKKEVKEVMALRNCVKQVHGGRRSSPRRWAAPRVDGAVR